MIEKKEVTKGAARADIAVSEAFELSRAQAARAIAMGLVTWEGKRIKKPSQPLDAEIQLCLQVPETAPASMEKQDIPIQILYQDEDLAVVVKPAGMVVHPAAGNENGTLVNALLFALPDLSGIGGVQRPGIVHRLDKDTSGLLLVAKNDMAHLALSNQLKARAMDKRYLALVEGTMKEREGVVNAPIGRSQRDRKKMAVILGGREAISEWRVLENLRNGTLIEVHILTGRTHQIRVHMRSIHHPVAGDSLYGFRQGGVQAPRLMLHAYSLAFDHPRSGKRMCMIAPPPQAFTNAVQRLRVDGGKPLPYQEW